MTLLDNYRPLTCEVSWQYGRDLTQYSMQFPTEEDAERYAARLCLTTGYRAIRLIIGEQERRITHDMICWAAKEMYT